MTEYKFKATIGIIGANPFVYIPEDILGDIFRQAGKDKGFIPIKGTVNNKPYKQTLVKYKGSWRLYINTTILKNSPKRIGEEIDVTIAFDPVKRTIDPHPKLLGALENNIKAKNVFDGLSPSKRNEIIRYISFLKSEESIDRNVKRAIDFLLGNGRFIGRDNP
jgi:hypothetical protein